MRDPYMLGFEIVTKNEENTRLVGAFAFRVGGEILLAPVFYLNGQIKGQDLLYRKGVSYLLSRGEDVEGRGVDRRALDARIHLDLRQLAGSRIHKNAAEEDKPSPSADFDPGTQVITVLPPDATTAERAEWEARGFIRRPVSRPIKVATDIKQLWKEAMASWSVTEPRLLFADFLLETGMQKQAAELAMKLPVFAEMIELSGALKTATALADSPEAEKKPMADLLPPEELVDVPAAVSPETAGNVQAAAGPEKQAVELFTAVQPGWTEPQLEEFYKQGFALRDSREMKYLSTAYVRSDMEQAWSSVVEPGVRQVTDVDGQTVKCLWAPEVDRRPWAENDLVGSAYRNDRRLGGNYLLVLLDGPDKGRSINYHSGTTPMDIPVFKDGGELLVEDLEIKGRKPTVGGTYAVWLPSLKKVLSSPFIVRTIKRSDGRTILNAGGDTLVINNDLTTNERDLEGNNGLPMIVGSDAVFIPLSCRVEYGPGAQTAENISWATAERPTSFRPLLTGRMDEALLKTKTAAVELRPAGHGRTDVLLNGRRRAEELNTAELVWKLATGLHLPGEEAIALASAYRNYQRLGGNVLVHLSQDCQLPFRVGGALRP